MIRILIADDHEVVRSGLYKVLECQANLQVVAEARNGKEAISKALETKPNVAVLDYSMPVFNGIEATRRIRERLPKTEVLIYTIHDDETLISDLLGAGARGYLLKTDLMRHLFEAIEALAVHKPFFTAKVSDTLLESFLALPPPMKLSDREQRMVQMIAEGHTNKQMAKTFNIGKSRIENQRGVLMRKLGLQSWAGIVRYAVRNGLVEP